jgi:hypothetical protein
VEKAPPPVEAERENPLHGVERRLKTYLSYQLLERLKTGIHYMELKVGQALFRNIVAYLGVESITWS